MATRKMIVELLDIRLSNYQDISANQECLLDMAKNMNLNEDHEESNLSNKSKCSRQSEKDINFENKIDSPCQKQRNVRQKINNIKKNPARKNPSRSTKYKINK